MLLQILLVALTQTATGNIRQGEDRWTHPPLSVSSVLQSHMVIQQNKPFKVWGKAAPGATVSIQADWMTSAIQVMADSNGQYQGIIDVPKATSGDYTSHTLTIRSNQQQIHLTDLLIGDLWFLSGQSNMQFAVREMQDSAVTLQHADNPHIRLLSVDLNFSEQPIGQIQGQWKLSSPATARDFSAVGYVFGAELQRQLDIPIGLIFSGIGASTVQAFVPKDVLQSDSLLNQVYLQPYLQDPKSKEPVDGGFSFEKVTRPYLLYNAMIHPFIPLSIKGFVWYQGETNYKERESYTRATIAMIQSWRERFKQGPLPFEYVQIAPFAHDKMDDRLTGDAFFREAQAKIRRLNNTEMALTIDVGDPKNLHPKNKRPVGLRLAKIALNRSYGQLAVPYRGPQLSQVCFQGAQATVHFKPGSLHGGLKTSDGQPPKYFTLAGKDRIFHPAKATIQGNTIVLRSDQVKKPVAVRYAFFNYPVTNLQNAGGLPAEPFRTDQWPEDKTADEK